MLGIFCSDLREKREVLKLPKSYLIVHPSISSFKVSSATDGGSVHLFAVSSSPTGLKGFGAAPLLNSLGKVL